MRLPKKILPLLTGSLSGRRLIKMLKINGSSQIVHTMIVKMSAARVRGVRRCGGSS
jgi:hypothetical protein